MAFIKHQSLFIEKACQSKVPRAVAVPIKAKFSPLKVYSISAPQRGKRPRVQKKFQCKPYSAVGTFFFSLVSLTV